MKKVLGKLYENLFHKTYKSPSGHPKRPICFNIEGSYVKLCHHAFQTNLYYKCSLHDIFYCKYLMGSLNQIP